MTRHSKTGLMLVEDPLFILKILCMLKGQEIDKIIFGKYYEEQKCLLSPKNLDCHFYSLTTFHLLNKISHSKYQFSDAGTELCRLLRNLKDIYKFQSFLANILLTNEDKGNLFRNFLLFVAEKKSKKDIYSRFRSEAGRSLIAWSETAGLIQTYGDYVQSIPRNLEKPNLARFTNVLFQIYKQMSKAHIFGIKRIYIPIEELRINVGHKLGLNKEEFNEMLQSLLLTDKNRNIILHGASTKIYEENQMETFIYNNKQYVFLSMRFDKWKKRD